MSALGSGIFFSDTQNPVSSGIQANYVNFDILIVCKYIVILENICPS